MSVNVNEFLYSDLRTYISLFQAVRAISEFNTCTDEQAGEVLQKLLLDNKITDLFIPHRGGVDCYNRFDDEIPFLKIKECVLIQISRLKETGDFDLTEVERNVFGYALTSSQIIADTLLFKKPLLKRILAEVKILLDSDSNIPELYKHHPEFGVGEANLIINNINPQDADNDYWQYPPQEVEIMDKIIEQNLDELQLIDTGKHWSDGSKRIFKHSTWRTWCKRHGHKWNIPDVETQSDEALLTTDPELKQRVLELQLALDATKIENEALRVQLSDAQKAINELRLLSNAKEATAPHYTHLMKIAIETQREFWGKWREGDTPPKQDSIKYELKQKNPKFSQIRIDAIEMIACPIDRKK